ncbi:RNA-directed DNA polymerase, eukaryota, Reverse transcriptase zinc-binding domain protein [Artemisia annua]|uniref:RNA-directed DNA polymerase, eukaryota, Reverse transcriptase zinc-binding domain protein n=1 Tax=Artemisia annua TaxID=35608 RepID=A0A2U1MFJ4_ARTAN|nr:RNA-directed DNA polymerase, eukaryota, Reverse transcriptase zinc-binding domain protein [Artemisia annua]
MVNIINGDSPRIVDNSYFKEDTPSTVLRKVDNHGFSNHKRKKADRLDSGGGNSSNDRPKKDNRLDLDDPFGLAPFILGSHVNLTRGGETLDCEQANFNNMEQEVRELNNELWDGKVNASETNSHANTSGKVNVEQKLKTCVKRIDKETECTMKLGSVVGAQLDSFQDLVRGTIVNEGVQFGVQETHISGSRAFDFYRIWGRDGMDLDMMEATGRSGGWPTAEMRALPRELSDHCPLLLTLVDSNFGAKPFRWFNSWLDRVGCEEEVIKVLEDHSYGGPPDIALNNKLKRLRDVLKSWLKKTQNKEAEDSKNMKEEIERIEKLMEERDLEEEEVWVWEECKKGLLQLNLSKSKDLQQKSRVRWAMQGDDNTAFFHGMIEGLMKNFLWAASNENRRMHWVSWDVVTTSKADGGLGISKLSDVNLALIAKWAWRFTINPNSLWRRLIVSIHGGRGKWVFLPLKTSLKGCWKAIVVTVGRIKLQHKGMDNYVRGKVGTGSDINFCWRRGPRSVEELSDLRDLLELVGSQSLSNQKDKWSWGIGDGEEFTVANMKKTLRKDRDTHRDFCMRWESWIPLKVNLHMWRAEMDRIPTRLALVRRGVNIQDVSCVNCDTGDESSMHTFTGCGITVIVWSFVERWCRLDPIIVFDVKDLLLIPDSVGGSKWAKKIVRGIIMTTCWVIWKARNAKVFEGVIPKVHEIVATIKSLSFLWLRSRSRFKIIQWKDWSVFPMYMM